QRQPQRRPTRGGFPDEPNRLRDIARFREDAPTDSSERGSHEQSLRKCNHEDTKARKVRFRPLHPTSDDGNVVLTRTCDSTSSCGSSNRVGSPKRPPAHVTRC